MIHECETENNASKDLKESNIVTSESTTDSNITEKDQAVSQNIEENELTDEYHYTKSGEFTSEVFKVVVQNIPKKIPYGRFRQTISDILGYSPRKVKFNSSHSYGFLTFRNEEERKKTIEKLNNYKWKDQILLCKNAPPSKDPFVRENKRKAEEQRANSKKHKPDEDTNIPPEERILKVVCPYASYSYEEQIRLKEMNIKGCIQKLTATMKRENIGTSWIYERKDRLCLELLPIIQSPVLKHYRNKVEFTIGKGPDEKDNTVGFRLGSYREGSILIVEPGRCLNCTEESLTIAKEFQTLIQTLPHPSYNITNHIGFWQQLTVRTCTTGDIMLIIQVNKSHLSEDGYNALTSQVMDYCLSVERKIKVTSVYMSSSSHKNNNVDTFAHLCGDKYVYERLLGLHFRISPDAFFQVNTPGAEILYKTVKDWCDTDQENACVLDVCCGTGTIGLTIANNSTMPVVGIEISSQAVEDAKYNATANGVDNANFICGPAEKVLRDEIQKINSKNIIAVVDPPRAGLHRDVIQLLRSCSLIKKIIYVSCSPKQAAENFISLCRPENKRRRGKPFKMNRAVPVDLFPQTPHCELIVELERFTYKHLKEDTIKKLDVRIVNETNIDGTKVIANELDGKKVTETNNINAESIEVKKEHYQANSKGDIEIKTET